MRRVIQATPGKGVKVLADASSNSVRNRELEKALSSSGIDITKFDVWQMKELKKGLKSGVDYQIYANPKFNEYQMRELREGLERA